MKRAILFTAILLSAVSAFGQVANYGGGGLGSVVLTGSPSGAGQVPTSTSATAATWQTPAGSGTVTHTGGALTLNHVVTGAGLADIKVDTGCTTDGAGGMTCTTFTGALTGNVTGNVSGTAASITGNLTGDTTSVGMATTTVKLNGTTVPTNAAADTFLGTTASAVAAWAVMPNCTDATGNHVNYTTATHLFSCGTSVPAAVVQTGQTNVYGAFLQDFTSGTMEIPEAAGCVTTVNATLCLDITNNIFKEWVNGADSIGVVEASAIAAGFIPKSTDATHGLLTASLCDEAITTANAITCTDTAGIRTPVFTSTGTTAGFTDFPQGTTSAAVAPCNTATSICEQAPAAVTSYLLNKLAGPSSGIKLESNSAAVLTESSSGDSNHSVHVTAQTATKTIYTLCPASAGGCNVAGQYRVTWYFNQGGTACGTPTPGQVTFALSWTDNAGAHAAIALPMNDNSSIAVFTAAFKFAASNTTGFASGEFNLWSTGAQPIQVTNTYTACGVGTGTWELTAAVEQVQ